MKLYKSHFSFVVVPLLAFTLAGCNTNEGPINPQTSPAGSEITDIFKASRGGMIWADCELYGTVGTPANFDPGSEPFDELYNIAPAGGEFMDGITAISESMPGDMDYNGGRWHVNVLKEGVDPAKYADACSVEDLDLDDWMATDVYFECPLLPRRGMNKASLGGMIWGDCEVYGTVGTPANFDPGSGPFDELYNIGAAGATFKDGIGAISESVPGDMDWNGGRWHVNVLKEGVDPAKYADACSVEDLDLEDWMATDVYFECPMLPRRGGRP